MEFQTYLLDDGRFITEGWFRDERFMPGFRWDGRTLLPGLVHLIGVRLLMGERPLSILDAEAEMSTMPYDYCLTALEGVKTIIGLNIASGFSEKVHRLFGGVKGCTHLTHLILAMAPAALHGYWTVQMAKTRPLPKKFDDVYGVKAWINSCQVWKEDGPIIRKIQAAFKS